MTGRRPRDDEGASAAELALVIPMLVALLSFGMFFAWTFFEQSQLDHAAARAARYAAVPTNGNTYAFCKQDVLTEVNSWFTHGKATDAELTVTDRTKAAPLCDATDPYRPPSGYVRVRITHTFDNPFTSLVSTFTPVDGRWTITGSAERRVETP